jgi:protein-tyrosine phosphatase
MSKDEPRPGAPIAAAANMRDLGGWRNSDGRRVRHGLLIRSSALDELEGASEESFMSLNVRSIYDLRVDQEREARPDVVPAGIDYFVLDVLKDDEAAAPAQIANIHTDPKLAEQLLGGGQAIKLFEMGYRQIVTLPSAVESYGRLFRELSLEERRPAVFHCTGGKDRTGWAAASILMLLGVPDEVVMKEYMLTNEQLLPANRPILEQFKAMGGDPELLMPVFGVYPEFLQAAIDEMRARFGDIEGYFTEGLGLDAGTVDALRNALTD